MPFYPYGGKITPSHPQGAKRGNLRAFLRCNPVAQSRSFIKIHKEVSKIFPQVASEFDHVRLYDHDGPKPRLVAECYRWQEIQVKDEKLYKKFLDKANYVYQKQQKMF